MNIKPLLVIVFATQSFAISNLCFAAGDAPSEVAPVQLAPAAAQLSNSSDFEMAKALIDAEKFAEAISKIEASNKFEKSPELLNLKGFALRKLGKTKEAISSYKKALKLKAQFPQAKEYLAVAYLQSQKTKEAKEIYVDLKKSAPEYAKMLEAEAEKMKIKLN